ncbi:hypothetical protein ACPV5T_02855 [Vibrio astriarenae]|uniref:hypothetical protein n=1 Tax=Vibrio sp. Makdt TaxID=2998828 RepID=UPI0022CDACEF|nr:hypothetical protein [Vibrio sp. Makdt]MDA0155133.1 hypothetical protein [Vibrio sp. Makdt]
MNSRDRKIQSIHNMMSLLASIESHPKKFSKDENLMSILSSQTSLAKASLPGNDSSESIIPMSLNTQKSLCALEFLEGYSKLDKQRLKAIAAINKIKNKGNKRKEQSTITTLEVNQSLMLENSLYAQIIDKLRGELKKALLSRPDNPEEEFENINRIINLQLQHVKLAKKS